MRAMNNELRTSPRHEFPYKQLAASVEDGRMPSLGDFCSVPCEDVSGSGIAFFLDNEPTAEEYVVALGKAQDLTYVCARVVHVQQIPHAGQLWYRVGCRFTGRARFNNTTLSVVKVWDDSGDSMRAAQQQQADSGPAAPTDEVPPKDLAALDGDPQRDS